MKHIFISYNKADYSWAKWIASCLEQEGYNVVSQAWDFQPGENFAEKMHEAFNQAEQTIAILPPDYSNTNFGYSQWKALLTPNRKGKKHHIIPVCVRETDLQDLQSSILCTDLVGLSERQAKVALLEAVSSEEHINKHIDKPVFPAISNSCFYKPEFTSNIIGTIDKERYSALLADILPRRIETEEENERYLEIVEDLMDKGGETLSPEETSLFNLLVTLIEDFEQRNYPMPDIPPNERIKYLLQEKELRQKDLLPIFGSEGIISEVLKGTRGITVRHAKELAKFFNVPVELFI